MHDYLAALLGGLLIGTASIGLMLLNGRIAGISGICAGIFVPNSPNFKWQMPFLGGLVFGGILTRIATPEAFESTLSTPLPILLIAGILVGYGTRMANGCTSGHGICGLGRFSTRSLVATLSFMSAGALTVAITHHMLGGSI